MCCQCPSVRRLVSLCRGAFGGIESGAFVILGNIPGNERTLRLPDSSEPGSVCGTEEMVLKTWTGSLNVASHVCLPGLHQCLWGHLGTPSLSCSIFHAALRAAFNSISLHLLLVGGFCCFIFLLVFV